MVHRDFLELQVPSALQVLQEREEHRAQEDPKDRLDQRENED